MRTLEIIDAPGPQILQSATISVVSPARIYRYHTVRLMQRTARRCLIQVKFCCGIKDGQEKILHSGNPADDLTFLELFYSTLFDLYGFRFLQWLTVKKIL